MPQKPVSLVSHIGLKIKLNYPPPHTSNTVVFWSGIGRAAQSRHSVLTLNGSLYTEFISDSPNLSGIKSKRGLHACFLCFTSSLMSSPVFPLRLSLPVDVRL